MIKNPDRRAMGSLFVLDQHRPAFRSLQPLAGGGGSQPPTPPAVVAAADDPRPDYLKNIKPPNGAMGQVNYRGWLRFMIARGQLNPFEEQVVKSVMRQSYPSAKQRAVLWYALCRIAPWGCGKWGAPS